MLDGQNNFDPIPRPTKVTTIFFGRKLSGSEVWYMSGTIANGPSKRRTFVRATPDSWRRRRRNAAAVVQATRVWAPRRHVSILTSLFTAGQGTNWVCDASRENRSESDYHHLSYRSHNITSDLRCFCLKETLIRSLHFKIDREKNARLKSDQMNLLVWKNDQLLSFTYCTWSFFETYPFTWLFFGTRHST